MLANDTIVASATLPGTSALAVVRLSGGDAIRVIGMLTQTPLEVRRATYAVLREGEERIDDVVLTHWKAPNSYTGEDVVEINCHGNPLIVERIIAAALRAGARQAEPGEFTQRAFLHGRMDLTQAEAVCDLIHAGSGRALRAAQRLQEGLLGRRIGDLKEELLQVLAHLEAHIDFPEEDINPQTGREWIERIHAVRRSLESLLATAPEGRRLREGFQVVLAGAPNAGKSSLLNALLERDRAIVSPTPGTTRDTVEDELTLEGIRLRLIDTAGIRGGGDEIERQGMQRTHRALNAADLVLWVIDPRQPGADPIPPPTGTPLLRCASRADLSPPAVTDTIPYSALSGAGLDEIRRHIIHHLQLDESAAAHESVAINTRHESLLRTAAESLERAADRAAESAPPELAGSDLRRALDALSQLTGETTNEDILDRLFQQFCIGK